MSTVSLLYDNWEKISLNFKEMIARLEFLEENSDINNDTKERITSLMSKFTKVESSLDDINDNLDSNNSSLGTSDIIFNDIFNKKKLVINKKTEKKIKRISVKLG